MSSHLKFKKRGPHGKGQAQVAIKEPSQPVLVAEEPKKPTTLSSWGLIKSIGDAFGASSSVSSLELKHDNGEGRRRKVEELSCSMTYVNVPWESIIWFGFNL